MPKLFESFLKAASFLLQSKSITASSSETSVTPDDGYDALSEVTINPQTHSDYYPSSSSYDSRGSGTSTIDLGANHDYRYIRVQNTSSSTYYNAITNVVYSNYWKFNDSGYNQQTVTLSISGLSTGSHYNYILLVVGRNYNNSPDVSISVSSGTLTTIASEGQSFSGSTGNKMMYIFARWEVSSSSASISVNRGSDRSYYATYNLTVYN